MRHLRFGRRPYWFAVITLIVLKFGGVMVMLSAPQTYGILHHVDTALVIVLALVVGGRFADIGWPRWFGITMVFLITLVLPLALFFAQPRIPARGQSPLDVLPDLAWISTVLLAILLIVAGIKRSASDFAADETGGTGAGYDNRKEPTFP